LRGAQHQAIRKREGEARRQQVLAARRGLLASAEEADPEGGALLRRVLGLAVQCMAVRADKDLCLSLAFAVHRKYLSELGIRVFGREAYWRMWEATLGEVMDFCVSDREMFSPRAVAAIQRRCRHHRVFEKMSAPPRLPVATEPVGQAAGAAIGDVIEGRPGAAGVATGRARVLHDIREIVALERGEVMVIPDIKPAWALAFGVASAVISADGHLLAHGAIMAREAGIPCVYIGEATKNLRTGDLVRVLGEQGRVEVLARPT